MPFLTKIKMVFFGSLILFATPVGAQDPTAAVCKTAANGAAFGMQQRIAGVDEQEAAAETMRRLKLLPSYLIKVAIGWVRAAYKGPIKDPQIYARDVELFCLENM